MNRRRGRSMLVTSMGIVLAAVAAIGAFVGVQGRRFHARVADDARALWAGAGRPVAPASLEGLPPPVRRYLEKSGAARRAPVTAVRLRHGGTFRPRLDGGWWPIRGEQYFSADSPGFVWWGRIRAAPGLWIDARDRSFRGEGNMLVKAASTFTIADARGPGMDRGSMLRLLGEMPWFPTAFLDARHVTWAPVDETSARATLRVGGREVSATFRFGPDGLPTTISADRQRDLGGGRSVLTPWVGECADFREVDGLLVPFRAEARWIVDGRPESYVRWEVERIELDRPEPY